MTHALKKQLRVDRSLDVRGVDIPGNYLKAKEAMDSLQDDQVLELYLDEGESLRRLPFGLRAEGHEILVSEMAKEGVRLLIRKRAPLSQAS